MYVAIWKILPGPVWLRAVQAFVLAAGVITALMLWVFPWFAAEFLVEPSTVG